VTKARRCLACGILALSLLASCATPGASGGPRVLALDAEGLRVSMPADWEAMRSGDVGFASGRVLSYMSNRALQADCGQEGGEQACTLPVRALDNGGVLLLWATSACAGVVCNLPDGDRRLISGREAAAATTVPACLYTRRLPAAPNAVHPIRAVSSDDRRTSPRRPTPAGVFVPAGRPS
jgi:hypothetical protein